MNNLDGITRYCLRCEADARGQQSRDDIPEPHTCGLERVADTRQGMNPAEDPMRAEQLRLLPPKVEAALEELCGFNEGDFTAIGNTIGAHITAQAARIAELEHIIAVKESLEEHALGLAATIVSRARLDALLWAKSCEDPEEYEPEIRRLESLLAQKPKEEPAREVDQTQMTPAPLDSATAVRLARFTYPTWPTGDRLYWKSPQENRAEWLAEDPERRSVTSLPEAWGKLDLAGQVVTHFRVWSLDDLAAAEQRVVAAGLEKAYSHELRVVLRADGCWPYESNLAKSRTVAIRTMKPEQVARALIQLLDQNPELEKAK